jgi:hypothetical protein
MEASPQKVIRIYGRHTGIRKPEEFGRGYYAFVFADPNGHRFNVFYM